MINIRKSLFETNSSSVHAICVAKDSNQGRFVFIQWDNIHTFSLSFGFLRVHVCIFKDSNNKESEKNISHQIVLNISQKKISYGIKHPHV